MALAPDIVDILNEDHTTLRVLCSALVGGCTDGPTVHLELSDRLLRHEIAEELVVYPVLLGYRGGAAVADGCLEDQASIERRLLLLGRQEPGTKEFKRISVALVCELLAHLDQEDSQVLPILASRLSRLRRTEMGAKFREIIQVAPPHLLPEGVRVATGPTVVDRTSALSVWMRDVAAASGLAG